MSCVFTPNIPRQLIQAAPSGSKIRSAPGPISVRLVAWCWPGPPNAAQTILRKTRVGLGERTVPQWGERAPKNMSLSSNSYTT